MKKFVVLLLVFAVSSLASAGTMVISGLPGVVNTSAGPVVLSFDVTSNGQLDDDSLYVWTYTGATIDIAGAVNHVVDGEVWDDSPVDWLLDYIPDITGVTAPILWADIAIPQVDPVIIVGDIITGIGLTIDQDFVGMIDVKVLAENSGIVENLFTIEAVIPEPITIALMGLGGLFLRRRK